MRANHALCGRPVIVLDETIPIHLNNVTAVSPVFKTALCGEFKERKEKSIVLIESTIDVVNVILDYAYGNVLSTDSVFHLQHIEYPE